MKSNAARTRVVYVDDDESSRLVFSATYAKRFEIMSFASGEEALPAIASDPPDAVVTDQRMPGITGTELLERVREISPGTRRLMLTAFDDVEARGHSDGCIQHYFVKPFDRQVLELAMTEDLASRVEIRARAVRDAAEEAARRAEARRTETDALYAEMRRMIGSTGGT